MGYRYYTTVGKNDTVPIWFGLSYTNFEYKDLKVSSEGVKFIVKNTGNVAGTEITHTLCRKAIGYHFPSGPRELKGFKRGGTGTGEEKEVQILFDDKSFRFYDTRTDSWGIESGTYQIMIGEDN